VRDSPRPKGQNRLKISTERSQLSVLMKKPIRALNLEGRRLRRPPRDADSVGRRGRVCLSAGVTRREAQAPPLMSVTSIDALSHHKVFICFP
jgi:hypothetical protein